MDVKKRNQAVSGFRLPSNKPKVLIVSLKAGGEVSRWSVPNVFLNLFTGVGLNLTVANHVFMVILFMCGTRLDLTPNLRWTAGGMLLLKIKVMLLVSGLDAHLKFCHSHRPGSQNWTRKECIRQAVHCEMSTPYRFAY
jgi:hypothetical protein